MQDEHKVILNTTTKKTLGHSIWDRYQPTCMRDNSDFILHFEATYDDINPLPEVITLILFVCIQPATCDEINPLQGVNTLI